MTVVERPVSELDVGTLLGRIRGRHSDAEIWYASVERHAVLVDRLARDVLSPDEQARMARHRLRDAAERYAITRALVRLVLARHIGDRRAARDIELSRTDGGKPYVSGGVHFNISHSGDLIVLALSRQGDVGVDVERKREVARLPQLSERWLTPAERSELSRRIESGADPSEAFLRVWTLKEARLKALGVGISGASSDVSQLDAVALDDLLSGCVDHAGRGYVGAVAFG